MVMELVTKDSLRNYLLKLREQWQELRKSLQIFFPQ